MKFRKKPVVIEATQWFPPGDERHVPIQGVDSMHPDAARKAGLNPDEYCHSVKTLEGRMSVKPGDWIITGVKGEKYPCKPDIFEATYETVE